MAFACNAQFTDDEFEHFCHISGLKREQKLLWAAVTAKNTNVANGLIVLFKKVQTFQK